MPHSLCLQTLPNKKKNPIRIQSLDEQNFRALLEPFRVYFLKAALENLKVLRFKNDQIHKVGGGRELPLWRYLGLKHNISNSP